MFKLKKSLIVAIFAWLIVAIGNISIAGEIAEITVNQWLKLGPLPVPVELFTQNNETNSLLKEPVLDLRNLQPSDSLILNWYPGISAVWRKISAEEIKLTETVKYPAVAYLAFYVSTNRRQTVSIKVEFSYPTSIYVDGVKQAQMGTVSENEALNLLYCDADFHTGKHIIIIKTVKLIETVEPEWIIRATISPEEGFTIESLSISANLQRGVTEYKDNYLIETISDLVFSPDGKKVALVRGRQIPNAWKRHRWIEIYSTSDSKLLRQIEFGENISNPYFSTRTDAIYFRSAEAEGTVLWRYNLNTGETKKVLPAIKNLVKLIISPDEEFAVYTVDGERKAKGNDSYTLLNNLEDRLTDWSDKRQIFLASFKDGITHTLTATGEFAVDEIALSPEGKKLAFTRRYPITGRPYYQTEFWLSNLQTGENRLLQSRKIPFESRPLNLTLLPNGQNLAFTSCNYFTDEMDSSGILHNQSEVDLWLMDLNTLQVKNLTGDTPFTVDEYGGTLNSLFWNPSDERLYFPVLVRGFNKVYSLDVKNPSDIREVILPQVYIKQVDLSAEGNKIVYTGSELNQPDQVFVYDLKRKQIRMLLDPNAMALKNITFGKYERWDFTDSKGYLIDGWLIYPPDFDPNKKYPMIVYYYAGVGNLDESFYFFYQFWCANGYVVYQLTPVGAIAHGEKFADYHTNDWGTNATQDIIEGVQRLLSEKKFLDGERMGCIGASYGGFTTMDLITKTDMFKAAVALFGISDIASYWGGGIWGYTYGDIALARSYPWNRKDIFTDKSPLYNADKVKTPLLLLHGEADVNVPELESEQMFTALRVQGKEVALVKFPGEDHGIAGKPENYLAHREMTLEWFDKYLKGQPQGWDRRWGK